MKIVPVLDLLDGNVVHAVRGQRSDYQPVRSSLCKTAEPYTIVQAFLELYPFETIYIADLDAINGTGDHDTTITDLVELHASVEFWVDRGMINGYESGHRQQLNQRCVIGSETGIGPDTLAALRDQNPEIILSLDFMDGKLSGDENLLRQTNAWPDTLIAMELDRVGTAGGPDMERLTSLKSLSGSGSLFAAGGIRNGGDLDTLKAAGIDGALIGTGLHSGTIGRNDLYRIQAKKMPRKAGHHPSNG